MSTPIWLTCSVQLVTHKCIKIKAWVEIYHKYTIYHEQEGHVVILTNRNKKLEIDKPCTNAMCTKEKKQGSFGSRL